MPAYLHGQISRVDAEGMGCVSWTEKPFRPAQFIRLEMCDLARDGTRVLICGCLPQGVV